jgi:tRNA U38,U39,U40 pseudouridine synthase TruA
LDLELRRPQQKRKVILLVGYGADVGGEAAASAVALGLEILEGQPVVKMTRCTDHKTRCSALFMSGNMPALEDVFIFGSNSVDNELDDGAAKATWLASLNAELRSQGIQCQVHNREFAHRDDQHINAETSCTVRVYDCVLPFGYVSDEPPPTDATSLNALSSKVKTVLRSLSSPISDKSGYRHRHSAAQIAIREQRRWHNFCDGQAEPSDAAVQRTIDRFHIYDATMQHGGEPGIVVFLGADRRPFLRVRVNADSVLAGQIERMIGTAVCILRGWLPANFAAAALDPTFLTEVPAIAPGLVTLVRARYDWNAPKQLIFRKGIRGQAPEASFAAFEEAQLSDMADSEAATDATLQKWVSEMTQTTCPRINDALSQTHAIGSNRDEYKQPCPPEYAEVLRLLREADASGLWPSTSRARARVVIEGAQCGGSMSAASPVALACKDFESGGSLYEGALAMKPSRANMLFPDLVEAIFALEHAIAPDRQASTMVAINRRATFRPHTDAGAGFGQSKSLIVGLGDYVGGELAVEGAPVNIRFAPCTFDGWRERHWTLPFEGERFSLVWFTPAAATQQDSPATRYAAPVSSNPNEHSF